MYNSAPRLQNSNPSLLVLSLEKYAEGWILSSQISQYSDHTLGNRRMVVRNCLAYRIDPTERRAYRERMQPEKSPEAITLPGLFVRGGRLSPTGR